MNKMIFMKAAFVTALPLALAVSAVAETRTELEDRSDPGSLNTSSQSIMNQKDSNLNRSNDSYMNRSNDSYMNRSNDRNLDRSDDRLARGMERDEPRAISDDSRRELDELTRDASEAYRSLAKGEQPVPDSVISKAQCIAIVPNVITAAAVVGATHGDGVVSCKSGGKWSSPDFMDLTAGSLGAQIGAKSTDIVMYFTSPEAVAALKRGKFAVGADASVVAGSFDRSFDTAGKGVIAYQRSSGAFLGAALNGGTLSHDEDSNRQFYGKTVSSSDILENRHSSDRQNPLASILPQG